MLRLQRAQLVISTLEGEVITSTLLEFEGVVNEYLTVASVRFIMGLEIEEVNRFIVQHGLITQGRHGQEWLNCSNLMPFFGWTPD